MRTPARLGRDLEALDVNSTVTALAAAISGLGIATLLPGIAEGDPGSLAGAAAAQRRSPTCLSPGGDLRSGVRPLPQAAADI